MLKFLIAVFVLSSSVHLLGQWLPDYRFTNHPDSSLTSPNNARCNAASGNIIHAAWYDNRDGNDEIYYKRSTDGGLTWGADTRLTTLTGVSFFASMQAAGQFVFAAWVENTDGNPEIYSKRSTDAGLTWEANVRQTNNPAISIRPTVSISGSNFHIVWQDNVDGNDDIYYRYSTNNGASFSSIERLTNDPAFSVYPCHTVSSAGIHCLWRDFRDGNWEVYYKRNPTGNLVSVHTISSGSPSIYSLGQNYPNPFNPMTKVKFEIPNSGFVKLKVYDVQGREVAVLVNEQLNQGTYEVDWNALNYPGGVYFYKLTSDGFSDAKRMVLVK